MGCGCSGKVIRAGPKGQQAQAPVVFGETGLVAVEYVGLSDINTYVGCFTGMAYPFGLFRRRGYVDRRDLEYLLKVVEDGQAVFEVIENGYRRQGNQANEAA